MWILVYIVWGGGIATGQIEFNDKKYCEQAIVEMIEADVAHKAVCIDRR